LLLALLAPSLPLRPAKTVVLLDQSPSARDAVNQLAAQLPQQTSFCLWCASTRYIAFASHAEVIPTATTRRLDLGEGTDLAEALSKAMETRPDRVVLLSDGLSQTAASSAVALFGLYAPPSPNISLLLLPPAYPQQGEQVEVRAVLESTAKARVRLTLEGPAGTQSRNLEVSPGRSSVGYRFALNQPSKVSASLSSPLGTREASLDISPSDRARVWVLGDAALAARLKGQGFTVTQPGQIALPIGAEVVALGVGARDLKPEELDALAAFLEQGGSLLWTATPKGLFFGGWDRSSLAEALPIEPREEPGGVGLVLVLDISGSMEDADKLALAQTGAIELVRSARPQDQIGVVVFASGYRWLFRPRPMTEQGRRIAEGQINSLNSGGGTSVGRAYAEAITALAAVPTQEKQILLLTDGQFEDSPGGLTQAAKAAATQKIRTNTVAIGADADPRILKDLAQSGDGNFWNVPSPADLPRFFLEEAGRAFKQKALEGVFSVAKSTHPVVEEVLPPPVRVVMPAKAKPWAQVPLSTGSIPLLALGESGRGRVATLGTDLSRSWQNWEGASGLMASLLRWLARTPARPRVGAVREAAGVRVELEGQFTRPRLRYNGTELDLSPVAPLRYETRLPQEASGEAVVLENDQIRLQVALPVQPEWRLEDGKASLKRLSEASGGRLLAVPTDLNGLQPRFPLPLRGPLITLALVLFLLERLAEWRRLKAMSVANSR
jgi:Mg-chelatase subunit ChlD